MNAELVERKVCEIVADQLGLGDDDVQMTASLSDDLGADTLDFLELVMAFEDEFELDINDGDVEKFETVQDVVNYLSVRMQ